MRNRRTLLLLSPFFIALGAHAAGCSAFLDTDSLQGGSSGTAGSAGAAGTGGDTDASSDAPADVGAEVDGGKPCKSDFDCDDGDACTVDVCNLPDGGTSGFCNPSQPWTGLAIEPNPKDPKEHEVLTADNIGLPVLASDDTDIVLAAWYQSGTTTDVQLSRYKDNASLGASTASLASLANFESLAASPGMAWELGSHRLRLLIAGKPPSPAGLGLYQWDLDADQMKAAVQQPQTTDLNAPGYDTAPERVAPRLYKPGVNPEVAMWLHAKHLWVYDEKNGTQAVFTQKDVSGFAPLIPYWGDAESAALETNANSVATTELWTRGSNSLTQITNNQPGARLGVAATSIFWFNLNLIAYAYQSSSNHPVVNFFGASCDATSCTSMSLPPGPGSQPLPGMFPVIDSAPTPKENGSFDIASSMVLPFDDPSDASTTVAALIATGIHVNSSAPAPDAGALLDAGTAPDAGSSVTQQMMNPPQFIVGAAALPKSSNTVPISQTAVSVTPTRQVFFAWVERGASSATLKVRRYQIRSCQ